MEKIIIKNFAGLDNVEICLNTINIFIGKQASGKSITAKLVYFFKSIPSDISKGLNEKKTKPEIIKTLSQKFLNYFPSHTWSTNNFEITYFFDEEFTKVVQIDHQRLKISFSEKYNKVFTNGKRIFLNIEASLVNSEAYEMWRHRTEFEERYNINVANILGSSALYKQTFIPAGRSFFANLQNSIFTFLSSSNSLDPLLVEFGSFYENIKNVFYHRQSISKNSSSLPIHPTATKLYQEIAGGSYLRDNNKDYLIHKDKRKINVAYSSSGQQETLPLLLILLTYSGRHTWRYGTTLFIEEPEAHLFPEAQKKIVELIALVLNQSNGKLQIIITTHSPYILSSFNNLIAAGTLIENGEIDENAVYKIIPKEYIISSGLLNAFSMKEGKIASIIDEDSNLVDSTYLDSVSDDISLEFDSLLNLI